MAPLSTTNAFQFLFQGMTPAFIVENTAPAGGGTLGYTNITPAIVQSLPLGKLVIFSISGGNVAIVWDQPGTLQSSPTLSPASWTTLSSATSPYVIPSAGAPQYFRLTQ